MSKMLNSQPFDMHSQLADAVVLHDYTSKVDTLTYKRQAAKRVKDYPGVERTEVKLQRIDPLTGEVIGTVIAQTAIKAGTPDSVRDSLMATLKAAEADSSWADLVHVQKLPGTVTV